MKAFKKVDKHPLAINVLKLGRYNFDFFTCEEVVLFEYLIVKGIAFNKKQFYHSGETIRKETGIKEHSLGSITKKFKKLGIISTEVKGMPRVTHYSVNYEKIIDLLPKIFKDDDNGIQLPEIKEQFSDFLELLPENTQEKNINKNTKKESLSDNETLEVYRDLISSLKYKYKRSDKAMEFDPSDLARALEEYDFPTICDYTTNFFKDESMPTLKRFFTFDKHSKNKLKYIEEQFATDMEYAEKFLERLQGTYKKRLDLFNSNDQNQRAKVPSELIFTSKVVKQCVQVLKYRKELQIEHAFTAYIDEILDGNLKRVDKILPYFLSKKEGEYQIIDKYADKHLIFYGYNKSSTDF